jgi:hypothetical protein
MTTRALVDESGQVSGHAVALVGVPAVHRKLVGETHYRSITLDLRENRGCRDVL